MFATKARIIKTETDISGVLLKGISSDFDNSFFSKNLLEGNIPSYNDTVVSDKIMLSSSISNKLNLSLGDDVVVYFFQEPTRVRKFVLSGIYETGFVDFDEIIMIVDIQNIQKLNNWKNKEVGGFEILIDKFDKLDEVTNYVYSKIPYNLNAQSIVEKTHSFLIG